jgi:hypothetical protein
MSLQVSCASVRAGAGANAGKPYQTAAETPPKKCPHTGPHPPAHVNHDALPLE